jgi:hypothetical protein
MDYEQTALIYRNFGFEKKFKEKPDYNRYTKEKSWYEKVRNKRTGEYYQADDLLKREMVPENWTPPDVDKKGKPLRYPIKHVNEIIRKRLADGSEWIITRQMWRGLDQTGTIIDISMNDKEMYDDPRPYYETVAENPKDDIRFRDTKTKNVVDRLEQRMKYTEPFKPETVQKLYDMRNGNCALTMIDESGPAHPGVGIPKESFEAFKNGPFEDLWQNAITPRYKLDRSYGDNLDNSHIG